MVSPSVITEFRTELGASGLECNSVRSSPDHRMNGENLVSLVSRLANKQRKLRKNAGLSCGPTVTEAVIELPQPRFQAAPEFSPRGAPRACKPRLAIDGGATRCPSRRCASWAKRL